MKPSKNIHILPTYKPSRLHFTEFEEELVFTPKSRQLDGVNIYITSDEEIKDKDYWIYISPPEWKDTDRIEVVKNVLPNSWFCKLHDKENYKNVILTTDQDLIKDGVQAIDDEFLEWFVKNPSCEKVEVEKAEHGMYKDDVYYKLSDKIFYKIIIPKEEPKQDKIMERFIANAKQETLEEATERFAVGIREEDYKDGFIDGAKWQIGKQDEFTLGFLHWYNTSQDCETYLRRNYPKNITMNGEHYKKVLEINKELLEMYKNTLPR